MLTPSAPGAAPAGLTSTGEPTFNRLWTLLGTPCVNVPGLVDAAGLPLGVQVIARFGRDRFALSAAAFLEQSSRGWAGDQATPRADPLTICQIRYYLVLSTEDTLYRDIHSRSSTSNLYARSKIIVRVNLHRNIRMLATLA